MEWPQRWPNLMQQIFQIGSNSDTVVVSLTLLQMLSEEISLMNGEISSEGSKGGDIPEDRKETLYQSMLLVVDDLLKFLESILVSLYSGYYQPLLNCFAGKC